MSTSALSWKTGDGMSWGLPAPMQLPSESDVSKSCRDSVEFALPDLIRYGETTGRKERALVKLTLAMITERKKM